MSNKKLLFTIAMVAFYLGAIGFFISNHFILGAVNMASGTIMLVALLGLAKKTNNSSTAESEANLPK